MISVERIESGPAWMDKTSIHSEADQTSYIEAQNGFAQAVRRGDANALAPWAPRITDWVVVRSTPIDQRTVTSLPKRSQTLAEVMAEALDYGDGPSMTEAMQLILNVAHGSDLVNAPAQARSLIERMGRSFAFHNT